MGLLEDIKARMDTNGDGKMSLEELESMRTPENSAVIDLLQAKARRYDGKLSMEGLDETLVKI